MNLFKRLGHVIAKSNSEGKVFAAMIVVGALFTGIIIVITLAFYLHPLMGLTGLGLVLARLTFFALSPEETK